MCTAPPRAETCLRSATLARPRRRTPAGVWSQAVSTRRPTDLGKGANHEPPVAQVHVTKLASLRHHYPSHRSEVPDLPFLTEHYWTRQAPPRQLCLGGPPRIVLRQLLTKWRVIQPYNRNELLHLGASGRPRNRRSTCGRPYYFASSKRTRRCAFVTNMESSNSVFVYDSWSTILAASSAIT